MVARHLKEEAEQVEVYLLAVPEELKGDAAKNYVRWREAGGSLHVVTKKTEWEKVRPAVASADVIVDALLGTGIRGGAQGLMARAIEDVNRDLAQRHGGHGPPGLWPWIRRRDCHRMESRRVARIARAFDGDVHRAEGGAIDWR